MRSSAIGSTTSKHLPHGAVVGTSSLRRQAQLRARRPDLDLRDLRGNVNTRLAKLDAGEYDAIVLACAGLARLGFESRIRARLDAPRLVACAGAGRDRDRMPRRRRRTPSRCCAALDDAATRECVEAERAMNRALHGSCHVPVAGLRAPRGRDAAPAGVGRLGERRARRARGMRRDGSRSAGHRSRRAPARAGRRATIDVDAQ